MRKFIFLILSLFSLLSYSQNQQEVVRILRNVESNIISYGNFTVKLDADGVCSELTISSNMFSIKSDGVELWYDGTTMWTYMEESQEVNVTEPTQEELCYINPYLILKDWNNIFDYKLVSKASGYIKILLTPRESADYESLMLYVDDKFNICMLSIANNNSDISDIRVTDLKTGIKVDKSMFAFDKKKYPNVEIIDLR